MKMNNCVCINDMKINSWLAFAFNKRYSIINTNKCVFCGSDDSIQIQRYQNIHIPIFHCQMLNASYAYTCFANATNISQYYRHTKAYSYATSLQTSSCSFCSNFCRIFCFCRMIVFVKKLNPRKIKLLALIAI